MKLITLLTLITLILGIVTLGLGGYNMAATEKHWMITESIIEWVRENSIEARAKNLTIPPLEDSDQLSTGARHYAAMCTECHLSPGKEATELALGLYPQAPVFHQQEPATNLDEEQLHTRKNFWVIKHGLKMTAMPAWGLSHDDKTIWAMTAFIHKLRGMSAEQYEELVDSHDEHHHH